MTRIITVQGRDYTVVDEPRLNGEIAPHLYDEAGECVGVLVGPYRIEGAPASWTPRDKVLAAMQILA
jgi:hypothetical protein